MPFDSGFPLKSLLIVGGVAANRWLIGRRLKYRFWSIGRWVETFPLSDPRFSGDNALGASPVWGWKKRMLI